MAELIGVGVVLIILVALVAGAFIEALAAVKHERDDAKKKLEDAELNATKAAAAAQATFDAEKKRYEDQLAFIKVELQKAEADLAKCSTPDAVRARLNGLFPPLPPLASTDTPPAGVLEGQGAKP